MCACVFVIVHVTALWKYMSQCVHVCVSIYTRVGEWVCGRYLCVGVYLSVCACVSVWMCVWMIVFVMCVYIWLYVGVYLLVCARVCVSV